MWSELASENFLTRSGGAGPQVHDHIVLRLAEHWSQPRIQRFDVEREHTDVDGRTRLWHHVGQ